MADNLEETLSDLAESFSLPRIALGDSGAVGLLIGELGELTVERLPDGGHVMLSLYRDVGDGNALRALELCGPSRPHPWPILAGMSRKGWTGFSARIPLEGFTVALCERFISYASDLLTALARK